LGLGKNSSLIVGLAIFSVSCFIIRNSNNKVLSAYVAFSWITIFGIAYSRAAIEPSTIWYTSRYQGVVISLWSAVAIQVSFFIKNNTKLMVETAIVVLLLGSTRISLAMQFENTSWYDFERSMAVIALINGTDERQVAHIYPDLMVVRSLTNQARNSCDGVFSSERFIDICINNNVNNPLRVGRANHLDSIALENNIKLNGSSFKIDEIDDWYKYSIIFDCNLQIIGRIQPIKIRTENKEILGIIGKDKKNFGNKCRVGFYAKSKINEFKNFDILKV
jgi:hypothetical protein